MMWELLGMADTSRSPAAFLQVNRGAESAGISVQSEAEAQELTKTHKNTCFKCVPQHISALN